MPQVWIMFKTLLGLQEYKMIVYFLSLNETKVNIGRLYDCTSFWKRNDDTIIILIAAENMWSNLEIKGQIWLKHIFRIHTESWTINCLIVGAHGNIVDRNKGHSSKLVKLYLSVKYTSSLFFRISARLITDYNAMTLLSVCIVPQALYGAYTAFFQ